MSWLSRFKNALHSKQLDVDLDDEIRDHLERRTADLQRQGLPPSDARRQASATFGNITGVRETSRELRLWAALEGTGQDLRYAWRGLLRNPAFSLTAVVSLGLAIGANTAIYSIVDAALLRPLPVPQPDRLFRLSTSGNSATLPETAGDDNFSYPLYEQLRAAAGDSAHLALFDSPNRVEARAFEADAPYEQVIQQFVSPDAFDILGIPPALGSLLSSAEDRYPGPRAVVVLSHDYWRRRFGSDPSVVGRRFVVDGRTYAILGVAREGFSGVQPGKFVDVWLPVTLTDPSIFTNPGIRLFHLLGRLAPGAARTRLAERLHPVLPLQIDSAATGISALRTTFARFLWILLGISACILLIACANVASLLLARSTARAAEMALRISLGARRARLVRQLLTESLVISLLAGVSGWLLARAAAPMLVAMVSTNANPVRLDLALDSRVLWFCASICTLSALFFGLLPAWQATAARPIFVLRHSAGQASRLRLGRLFVGVQVAFAFCLVTVGAGFLLSLHHLAAVDTGFDPRGVTVLTITNSPQRDRQLAILQQVQRQTAALPNVEGAATGWMALFAGARRAQRVALPGQPLSQKDATFYRVSPGYFATLRTPLLSGRELSFRDDDTEPVATVVNRAFARRYLGGDAVIGREFLRDDGVRHRIVGLAANSHFGDLRDGPEPIAFMPMKPPRAFTLYVRSLMNSGSVAKMVERELHPMGSDVRVRDVTTLDALVGSSILMETLLARLGGAFALLGLILAAVGLFGMLNYSVTRRTREIGIRTALGARRAAVYSLVFRDLLGMIGGGLTAGLAGSLVLLRITHSLLFGIEPADPVVIGAAALVFLGAAIVAGGVPAHRAAAIDPVAALRNE